METWANEIFYVCFAGQIAMLSWWIPRQIKARMNQVINQYPACDYPKLYPRTEDEYRRWNRLYGRVNHGIILVGLFLLYAIAHWVDHATFADDGYISVFWPMLYGAIQFVPLIWLEVSSYNQLKQMRRQQTQSVRAASLTPRRVLDHVSAILFGIALVLIPAVILSDLAVHDFEVYWTHDAVVRSLILVATNLYFVGFGYWYLFGRKQNPYQSDTDRQHQIRAQLAAMLWCSIAMSLFFMTQVIDDVIPIDAIESAILSLYLQLVAFFSIGTILRHQRIKDMDFSVYRADPDLKQPT